MNTKFSKLFSAAGLVVAVALVGPVLTPDIASAAEKKSDRLPVAAMSQNTCESQILGSMTDECVQKIVDGASIKTVKTTVVELRDEDARISTLVRMPSVEVATVQP